MNARASGLAARRYIDRRRVMSHTQAPQRKTYVAKASLEVFYTGGPCRLSHDGTMVAAACHEAVNIVEVGTGKVVHNLPGDTEPITALCWSRDGRRVFTASRSMRCSVWDATTGESVRTFKAHSTPVLYMGVDPTGTLLVTTSADRTARVWDIDKGFCTHAFRGHGGMVTVACFHPDARKLQLYTGSQDGEVRAWSLRERKCVGVLQAHQSSVTAIQVPMAADGGADKLITCARDRVVHEWNLKTMKRISTLPVHEAAEGLVCLDPAAAAGLIGKAAVRAAPDAIYFATAGEKGMIRVWRMGTGKPVSSAVHLMAGRVVGAAHEGQEEDEEQDDAAAGTFVSLQPTSKGDGLLAVTGDSRLLFYGSGEVEDRDEEDEEEDDRDDEEEGKIVIQKELIGNTDEIIAAAFLPLRDGSKHGSTSEKVGDGKPALNALAVATNSSLLRVFDPSTMSCTAALTGHSGAILSLDVAVGPNGESLVLTGSRDHTVRLWDLAPAARAVATGRAVAGGAATTAGAKCLAVGQGHVGAVAAVALAKRNGAPLALSGGADKVARVWDIAGALAAYAEARAEAFEAAGIDPKKHKGDHPSVRMEPVLLGAKAAAIAHDKAVNCAAIAPNLTLGATCSGDRTARLWRLPDLIPAGTLRGHKRGVWAVAFSPTDRIIATAGGDKFIKLWSCDPNAGVQSSCLRTLEGHTAAVLSLRFISSGTQIVSTGSDGLLVLWGVRTGAAVATLDGHDDKAWALASDADGDVLATGGADAKLTLWEDGTAEAAEEEAKELALKAGTQQALSNAAASGEHLKAAHLALKLGHPFALRKAIEAMIADPEGHGDAALDSFCSGMKGKTLHRYLSYIREWNANAKFCEAAQRCMASLFRLHSLSELSGVAGAKDTCETLKAFTTRHFARAGRLLRGTYLLDVALAGMGALLDDDAEGDLNIDDEVKTTDHRGIIAEMGFTPTDTNEIDTFGRLGIPAKPAARTPVLTKLPEHVGGDDMDDFDFDMEDDKGDAEELEGEMDEEEEEAEEDPSDSDSDAPPREVVTKKAPAKGKRAAPVKAPEPEPESDSDSDAPPMEVVTKKAPQRGRPPKAPKSSKSAAEELGLAAPPAISPRKTRRQRRESESEQVELEPEPEPKKKAAAKTPAKRKAAPKKEEAAPAKRSTRSRK